MQSSNDGDRGQQHGLYAFFGLGWERAGTGRSDETGRTDCADEKEKRNLRRKRADGTHGNYSLVTCFTNGDDAKVIRVVSMKINGERETTKEQKSFERKKRINFSSRRNLKLVGKK